jgi:hypothetical protein
MAIGDSLVRPLYRKSPAPAFASVQLSRRSFSNPAAGLMTRSLMYPSRLPYTVYGLCSPVLSSTHSNAFSVCMRRHRPSSVISGEKKTLLRGSAEFRVEHGGAGCGDARNVRKACRACVDGLKSSPLNNFSTNDSIGCALPLVRIPRVSRSFLAPGQSCMGPTKSRQTILGRCIPFTS